MTTDREKLLSCYSDKTRPSLLSEEHIFNADDCLYKTYLNIFDRHEENHWMPSSIDFKKDVADWNRKLKDDEKAILSDFLKFFTQADVGVHDGYANVLKPTFSGIKAIEFTLGSIENREAVHCRAYSMLLNQLGFKTSDFLEFMEIPVMKKKEDYVLEFHGDTPENVAKTLAVFGAFVEGIQLFSSFAMMMNFSRFNSFPAWRRWLNGA